jgi:hypothetical protein
VNDKTLFDLINGYGAPAVLVGDKLRPTRQEKFHEGDYFYRYADVVAICKAAAAPASLTPAPQGTASELIGLVKAYRAHLKLRSIGAPKSVVDEEIARIDAILAASLAQAATSEPVAKVVSATGPNFGGELRVAWLRPEGLNVGDNLFAAPAAAHPAPSDERAAFEGHVMADELTNDWSNPTAVWQQPNGEYFYAHVQVAWRAWQARAALSAQQAGVQEAPKIQRWDYFGDSNTMEESETGRFYRAIEVDPLLAALSASSAVTNEDAKDAHRLRWLTADHDNADERQRARDLAVRLGTSSHFATTRDIDSSMAEFAALASQGVKGGE